MYSLLIDDGAMKSFLMKLDRIQPTQLYINSEKLNTVMRRISPYESIEPIPVKRLGDQIVFVDGHTRAFAAFMQGFPEVPVCWEDADLDWEAYKICVEWCKDEGICTIAALKNRAISDEEYKVLWLNRCAEMQKRLRSRKKEVR